MLRVNGVSKVSVAVTDCFLLPGIDYILISNVCGNEIAYCTLSNLGEIASNLDGDTAHPRFK